MVVPERVKIRFDASECCNIFALARSDELMNLPKNAHIVGSILGGCRSLIRVFCFVHLGTSQDFLICWLKL
jgi:hypothetical protein